jgi:hypothetical protein
MTLRSGLQAATLILALVVTAAWIGFVGYEVFELADWLI